MSSPIIWVKKQQSTWAKTKGIECDQSSYTINPDDNLYIPLSDDSRKEFASGDGGELGTPDKRGKMQALHSSSALACNVFEYWRGRDCSVLANALNLSGDVTKMEFERKFKTGLPGNAPNLDIVLTSDDGSITAIESKFLEPYSRNQKGFKEKYFESDTGLWKQAGFSNCQEFAECLQKGIASFRWLHAEQLLKHILGLKKSELKWKLLYLWYETPSTASSEHAQEINEFALVLAADGILFQSMSYQELFSGMRSYTDEADQDYLSYLESRYFG